MENHNLTKALFANNLEEANCILGGYGIEYVSVGKRELAYVNLGGPYTRTICQEGDDFTICCWGDWIKAVETDRAKENSELLCANCGQTTPLIKNLSWRDHICCHCNRNVSTGEKI